MKMLIALLLLGCLPGLALAAEPALMMATTTSTNDTGLLDYLAPEFKKDTGIELKWTSTGTGKALKLGETCDVDVVLVHAPKAEKEFMAQGFADSRREVMYNDFVILGPASDPAHLKAKYPKDATAALGAIKASGAPFISRGDNSGTHMLEVEMWKAQGDVPDKQAWYSQSGQGMMQTLAVAEEKKAYTLCDRATLLSYQNQKGANAPMVVLVEGDPKLFNQYSVLTLAPAKCPNAKHQEAKKFSDWLASARGQKLVGDFKLFNKQLYIPNAK